MFFRKRPHTDLICANDVSATDAGFAVDNNRVTILDRSGGREDIPLLPMYDVAHCILDRGLANRAEAPEVKGSKGCSAQYSYVVPPSCKRSHNAILSITSP
jgi:hypothetical protein